MKQPKDENYIIDLCDSILNSFASRQHRFDFLRGDPGKRRQGIRLPVDAYYADLKLVIEYRERQHSEAVTFFDKPDKLTVSGVSRGEQRAKYDQRRRDVLKRNGIRLVELSFDDFEYNSSKRLVRTTVKDLQILRAKLTEAKIIG
jgi:hypothetical protein